MPLTYVYQNHQIPQMYDHQVHGVYFPYHYTYMDYSEQNNSTNSTNSTSNKINTTSNNSNTNGINTYSNQYEHTSDHQWENHPNQPLTVPIASRSDRVSSPSQHTHLSATPMETSKSLPNLSKSGSLSSKKSKKNIAESTSPTTLLGRSLSKRSRMGCLTCRSRKKRCCETKPKCTECARLKLNCVWPKPGTEHKNKPKDAKQDENTIDHEVYGTIKVLRGIVEYRSDA